jgi:hypothetical protein
MKRLKGPEIKMPELRMPRFLVDLYRDLDDRHLLPIVALLVVAIIAIPFVLGDSGSTEKEGAGAEPGATTSVAPGAQRSAMVVVNEDPRLRDYQRRLKHLHAKDPFKQRAAQSENAETSSASSAESITEVETSTSTESSATTESGGGTPSTSESGTTKSKVTYFSYAIDVRVTPVSTADGKPSKAEPTVRHELPPLVMLPSRDTPALTYIGPSRDGKKAMMLVSSEVTALFGDSNCIVGSQSCQMLALKPGLPETVVYGPAGRTYRIELLKIQIVYTDHLEVAPLGKPKTSEKSG